ncbi:uncharacterized protein [Brachyistius frenatus]|uniref:uncharacterized protein n=1 Tax=Brachyistius frenatus TaxID=100188 RepID=UPI0037E8804B
MFRISLIVCVSLIFGVTAKSLNKLTDEAFQEAVVSIDEKGKMSWKVEVEPPEEMDEIQYKIDPSMKIWKSMKNQDKQPLQVKEDLDELHHPSMADLLQVQIQNLDPAAAIQAERFQGGADLKYSEEAEKDKDDIDHPVFSEVASEEPEQDRDEIYHKAREQLDVYLAPLVAEYKVGAEVRGALYEPEKDDNDLYHHNDQPVMEPRRRELKGDSEVRVHLQPEEDMDDLYHQDFFMPVHYHDDTEAAAPVDLPSQMKYSEPEVDLDDFYHQ